MVVLSFIHRLCGGNAGPIALAAEGAPNPDQALCLVGDIHGRLDLLQQLMACHERAFADYRLVFLGDAIDRGPASAGVLHRLQELAAGGAIVLRGNHEAMLLAFLDDPADEASTRWLIHGGREFLASFGVTIGQDEEADSASARITARDSLRAAMGPELETWLRALPCLWQSGDLVAAHAGMDLHLPLDQQTEATLLWGNPTRMPGLRADGLWVAHGHVISERAYVRDRRIALDTGAYASGVLSYALVEPQGPEIRLGYVKG